MPISSNLERRGAVYYWRRRVPSRLHVRLGMASVRISLRTRNARTARLIDTR